MLRKLYLVPVLALLALPALAQAQFEAGNWEMRLAGSGSNDRTSGPLTSTSTWALVTSRPRNSSWAFVRV